MSLENIYADLHIHIGRDMNNRPVKITGAKSLTLTNILIEASRNKGVDLIGIIDCHAPGVQAEIKQLLETNEAVELADGGIRFESVTLILGAEIEIYDHSCGGPIHVLCYFPFIKTMEVFTEWLATRMTNINLSSQRIYATAKELQYKVKELGGLFIPAHVFTPFKSLYGKGVVSTLSEVLDADLIDAIELGLSADTKMADSIQELHNYTFLTNSDAHSLPKIAREYQSMLVKDVTFKELYWVLHQIEGRRVLANFGMHPQLGKYYTTVCKHCLAESTQDQYCLTCGKQGVVKGVSTRIKELANAIDIPKKRPPYNYQVPLEYLSGLGKKTFEKLLSRFGTEMQIIHQTSEEELAEVVKPSIAKQIIQMRKGILQIQAGGGGKYGRVN